MVEVTVEPETVQVYVQIAEEAVAVISWLVTIPLRLMVGVAAMLSENVAVIVTTSELETILSESVCDKVTVGAVESLALNFKTIEEVLVWLSATLRINE